MDVNLQTGNKNSFMGRYNSRGPMGSKAPFIETMSV